MTDSAKDSLDIIRALIQHGHLAHADNCFSRADVCTCGFDDTLKRIRSLLKEDSEQVSAIYHVSHTHFENGKPCEDCVSRERMLYEIRQVTEKHLCDCACCQVVREALIR